MANQFNTSNAAGIDFSTTYYVSSTTPDYPGLPVSLGTVEKGSDESEWVFCSASTDITLGQVLILTTAWSATPSTTTAAAASLGLPVAVAPLTAVSSGAGFWAQRQGTCNAILTRATTTANVALYTSTTAGTVYSATTTGNVAISGIYLTTTNATAGQTKPGFLNFPVVGAATT